MTLKELINLVRSVSGEDGYAEEGDVINALNLALGRIYTEIGIFGKASVLLRAPRTERIVEQIRHKAGEVEVFSLGGVAYSFVAYGRGRAVIKDGTVTRTEEFDGYGVKVRGLVRHGGSVRFEGEFAFFIKNFVAYSELLDSSLDSIPVFGEGQRVPLARVVSDFSSTVGAPTGRFGRMRDAVYFEGDTLVADSGFTGEVFFTYRKRPPVLSPDALNEDLKLPFSVESALVNLAAAYLLISADSDTASFFTSEYERIRDTLKNGDTRSRYDKYINDTRWA